MEEVPGKGEGNVRYVYRGYVYHQDTTSVNIYRCSTRSTTRCRGSAWVDEDGHVEEKTAHDDHQPNHNILEVFRMQREMLDIAGRTNTPLKEIFDTVCRRNPVVAANILYTRMKYSMQRARAKARPPIPGSMRELGDALANYPPTAETYRGLVEGDDGSVALIFASDLMLRTLSTSAEIYVDGTFKVAPHNPAIAQLYTIHMRVMDTGIAAVYVLCSARTRSLYAAIFNRVVDLAPGLSENIRFVMGDYERAAMTACRQVFPEAAIHGCWFHFNQALLRKWRNLGLTNAPTSVLAMAMALPLAPAERFDEGIALLADIADQVAIAHPPVLIFMRYLRTQWSPLAAVVSVHGCPSRPNNLVESFHNEAKRKLGGLHPNIWKFIDHLSEMMTDQGIDLVRLQTGARPRRPRTVRNMEKDTVIRNAQHDLSVDRYTLRDFLTRCANRTVDFVVAIPHAEPEPEAQEQDLVEPGVMAVGEPEINRPDRRPAAARAAPGNRGRGARRIPEVAEVQPAPAPTAAEPDALRPEINRARGRARARGRGRGRAAEDGPPDIGVDDVEEPEPRLPGPAKIGRDDENEDPEERHPNACCVCYEGPATHAFVPCAHQCCCANCAQRIADRCPLCRTPFTGVYRIMIINN